MPLQMRDVLKEQNVVAERNMVEQDEVLMDLTHVADVGHYRVA